MCEYCEKKKEVKSCNFGGRASMRVVGNILDIYGDKDIFSIFRHTYRPRFEIEYCPMCGKKLKSLR